MKNARLITALLVATLAGGAMAADVVVEYSGPSGQGTASYVGKSTDTTIMTMTEDGLTAMLIKDEVTVVSTNGATTNVVITVDGELDGATIEAGSVGAAALDATIVTNVLADGMTLPAVSGEAVTNLTAGNIAAGGALTAVSGAALTNITPANIADGNLPVGVVSLALTASAEISVASGQNVLKDGSPASAISATNTASVTLAGIIVNLQATGGTNNATNDITLSALAAGEAGNMFYFYNSGTTNNITITNGAVWLSPTIVLEETEVGWATAITSNTFYGGVLGQ